MSEINSIELTCPRCNLTVIYNVEYIIRKVDEYYGIDEDALAVIDEIVATLKDKVPNEEKEEAQ